MDDESKVICICAVFLGFAILLILNGLFWLDKVTIPNCESNFESECFDVLFVSHGLAWWHYLILSLVIIEVSFIILIYFTKKEESLWEYVFILKFASILCLAIFYLVVFPLGWLIYKLIPFIPAIVLAIGSAIVSAWKPLVFFIGFLGLIGLYYLINIGIAKLILDSKKKNKKTKTKRAKTSSRRSRR